MHLKCLDIDKIQDCNVFKIGAFMFLYMLCMGIKDGILTISSLKHIKCMKQRNLMATISFAQMLDVIVLITLGVLVCERNNDPSEP